MITEKLTDMLVSAILKKGILGEIKPFKTEIEIPQDNDKKPIKITITSDCIQVKLNKDDE